MIWDQFFQKICFLSKTEKNEHQRILHLGISLETKFYLNKAISNLWPKFAQKGYFRSKLEKVTIIIEFSIIELILNTSFNLNRRFWLLFPKTEWNFWERRSNVEWMKFWVSFLDKFVYS